MGYVDEGIDQRAEVAKDMADTLIFYVKKNGEPVIVDASSAYVTVKDPAGVEVVARTAATIGTNGKLSIQRTWADELGEDYSALWEWTAGSVAAADRQFFDVVLTKLNCPIDTSDIQESYPDIVNHLGSLGETDAKKFIKRAWSMLLDKIRSGHNRPSLILDKVRLVNPAVELTAHRICLALARQFDDIWWNRQALHKANFDALWAGLGELKYDRDEDSLASDMEGTARVNRKRFSI